MEKIDPFNKQISPEQQIDSNLAKADKIIFTILDAAADTARGIISKMREVAGNLVE